MSRPHLIGLGVAGNFTGHLEQAGEAADFVDVLTREAKAPKGLFPWYVPDGPAHLRAFPVGAARLPHPGGDRVIQTEPEVGLFCTLSYAHGQVSAVVPHHMAAWNDGSIRRPPAPKISLKKNWGAGSKGCADTRIPIAGLRPGGTADRYRLASWLIRDGRCMAYGEDSPVVGYSYFHDTLLDWLVDRLNHQRDGGPLEDISALLATAGRPEEAWISIGATRYTPEGADCFLEVGDQSLVVLYDGERYDADAVAERIQRGDDLGPGLSVLRQRVVGSAG